MNEATQIVREAGGCVFFAAITLYIGTLIPSHPVQKITNIVIGSGLIYVSCRMEKLEKMLLPYEAIAHQQRLIPCHEWLEGMEAALANIDDLNPQPQSVAPATIFTKILNYLEGKDWKKDYEVKAGIREFKDANSPLPEIQGYLQFLETENLLETRSTSRGSLEARVIRDKTP